MRLPVWIAVRVAVGAATLTALSALVFWATEVLPGDAVGTLSGPDATAAEREAVRVRLGLDRPPLERYLDWAGAVLHGDLGTSMSSNRSVAEIVLDRAAASFAVVVPAAVLILVFATVLGTWAGMNADSRLDRVLSGTTLVLVSVPDFLTATAALLLFTLFWPVLPTVVIVPSGDSLWQHPDLVAVPALALAIAGFGASMRLLRAGVAQVATAPYAEFARLNGVRGLRYVRIVVMNAAGPAVHTFTVMTAGLVGGGIVVENLFNVPGLGNELTTAISIRDVPLVQGLSLTLGAITLSVLFAGDVATRLISRHTVRGVEPL